MTDFIKCALLLIANDQGGSIQITDNDLVKCEVDAQNGVSKPTPNPLPTTRSTSPTNTTNNTTNTTTNNNGNSSNENNGNQGIIPDNFPLLGGL